MQTSRQPSQVPDFIIKMIPDRTSELYTDPNSPYNRDPHFAALIDKARNQLDAIEKTKQLITDLEKDALEIKHDHQAVKHKFVEALARTPITLDPSCKTSPSTHRFYKPINRKTESTPLLTKKTEPDFDCCKMIRKIFGC